MEQTAFWVNKYSFSLLNIYYHLVVIIEYIRYKSSIVALLVQCFGLNSVATLACYDHALHVNTQNKWDKTFHTYNQ